MSAGRRGHGADLGPLGVSGCPAGSAGLSGHAQHRGCLLLGARVWTGCSQVLRCPPDCVPLKLCLPEAGNHPRKRPKTTSSHQGPHPSFLVSLGIWSHRLIPREFRLQD